MSRKKKDADTQLSFRIPEEHKRFLLKRAKKNKVTLAKYVRNIVLTDIFIKTQEIEGPHQ